MVLAGLEDKRVLLAFAVLVIAFVVWTQNMMDNSVLVFLAAAAVLVIALMGTVHGGDDGNGNDSDSHDSHSGHDEIEGLSEHPESHEEEAHGISAGH